MTVTAIDKDPAARTMSLTAEFAAPVEVVWSMISDPRRLERWWGPPGYPASFADFTLTPGEHVAYSMTGPEGDVSRAWWRVVAVNAPHRLEVEDGFADQNGVPSKAMPEMTMVFTVSDLGAGKTRLHTVTTFPSVEAMDQLVEMGMEEGMRAAAGQLDALVAEYATA